MMVTIQSDDEPGFLGRTVETSEEITYTLARKLHLKNSTGLQLVDMDRITRDKVQNYLTAIAKNKSEIVQLYNSDPQEYNLLAQMAFGILGNESEFFTSTKYLAKISGRSLITPLKKIRSLVDDKFVISPNSSGPTQIKVVPQKIAERFGVTSASLSKYPEHAAVATMGYLIEALRELKQRATNNNLDFITPETYVDYLPYLYFGRSKLLNNVKSNDPTLEKAEPHKNLYVLRMKKYMEWVQLYETPPIR